MATETELMHLMHEVGFGLVGKDGSMVRVVQVL